MNRVTVIEQIHYEQGGEQPLSWERRFFQIVSLSEQPYSRTLRAGSTPRKLEAGWIENPGMLLILNDEGRPGDVILSAEEKAAIERRILVVDTGGVQLFIPPRDLLRITPSCVTDLQISCPIDDCRFTLVVFPK